METEKKKYEVYHKSIKASLCEEDTDFGTYHTVVIGFLHYKAKSYARSKENAFILALEALARKMREE